MPDILSLLDNIAALNGGPVVRNGHDYIAIRREDWEALVALRGDGAAPLAPREAGRLDAEAEGDGPWARVRRADLRALMERLRRLEKAAFARPAPADHASAPGATDKGGCCHGDV
jgi:hypothetical protein